MKKLFYILLALVFSVSVYADITPLPDPPSKAEPSTFADKADAFLGALPTFATEANTLASDVNSDAADAASSAATAMSAANFKGAWSDQTGAAAIPYSVYHEGYHWQLINGLADVTTSEPGVTADWKVIGNQLVVTDLTDLGALVSVETGAAVYMKGRTSDGDGGQGWWVLTAGDFTTELAADTLNGVYLEYSGEDGSTRAWVRQRSGLKTSWFGASPAQTASVNTPAIQSAFDFLSELDSDGVYASGSLEFDIPGVYDVNDQLDIDHTIDGAKIFCNKWARLNYTGSTDSSKAVVRIKADGVTGFYVNGLVWDSVHITANSKAGFCMYAGATDVGTTRGVKNCTFRNSTFEGGSIAGFMGGDYNVPELADTDFSANRFEHMTFYNSLYNVILNATDVYITKFDHCVFASNVAASTKQHVRLIVTGGTWFRQCEFSGLTYNSTDLNDGVYCVYARSGGVSIVDSYTEETRLLNTHSMLRTQERVVVQNVYMNDGRLTAGSVDLTDSYVIYSNYAISVKDCDFYNSIRPLKMYVGTWYEISNVNLGAAGYIERGNPYQGTIEGLRSGQFKALNKNFDFGRWQTSGQAFEFDNYVGAGGTATVTQSTSNNYFGDYTSHINCTVAATTYVAGHRMYYPRINGQWMTCIMTGTLSADTVTPSINFDSVASGGTNVIIKDDLTFIAWAEADCTGTADAVASMFFGIAPNVTGEMWIDSVVLLNGRYTNGSHSAIVNPIPDEVNPAEYAGYGTPDATASGYWRQGDHIINLTVSAGGSPGWTCTTSGASGTAVFKTDATVAP